MTNSQEAVESTQPGEITNWLIAISKVLNADGKLAPGKAVQKRLQEFTKVYGTARVWEAIKQYSMSLGMNNASITEALFQNHPDLPNLMKTDSGTKEALNRWFERNAEDVTRFRKVSTAMLRANPVVEWTLESSPGANQDLEPIMEILFRNPEGTK